MGKAIHRRLTANALEGTTLLKFIYLNCIMANSLSDTGPLLPMSAHYATNQTHAHALREYALTIRLSPLAATMRRVN